MSNSRSSRNYYGMNIMSPEAIALNEKADKRMSDFAPLLLSNVQKMKNSMVKDFEQLNAKSDAAMRNMAPISLSLPV